MAVANRIRTERKRLSLTQEEVAQRAGLTLNGYADIERGKIADPHISSLRKIAEALKVPIGALLGEEQPTLPLDEAPVIKTTTLTGPDADLLATLMELYDRVRSGQDLPWPADDMFRMADPMDQVAQKYLHRDEGDREVNSEIAMHAAATAWALRTWAAHAPNPRDVKREAQSEVRRYIEVAEALATAA